MSTRVEPLNKCKITNKKEIIIITTTINFAVIITILAILLILCAGSLDSQSHIPRCSFNNAGWQRPTECVPTVGTYHKTFVSDKQGD